MPDQDIIYEPAANLFEAEHRGQYTPHPTAHVGVILEGKVKPLPQAINGNESDTFVNHYEIRMLVGPYWRDVQSVVPRVTIDGYYHTNPDQDDIMRWHIRDLTWDTVGQLGPNNERRIRLKFFLDMGGEHAQISGIGYYLMASGRRLGEGGLNKPGPVKPQGG